MSTSTPPPRTPPPPAPSVGIGAEYSDPAGQAHVPHAPRDVRSAPPARLGGLLVLTRRREAVLTAAVAVGAVILVKFTVAFVNLIGNAIDFDPAAYASGFGHSPIGLFLGALVLVPFPFYLGAFISLAFALPIVREASLSQVLGRSLLAGAAGTILLAVAGLVTSISTSLTVNGPVGLLLDVVFVPLSGGIVLTALLAAGGVVAWLWNGRQEPLVRAQAQDAAAAAGTAAPAPDAAAPSPDTAAPSPDTAGLALRAADHVLDPAAAVLQPAAPVFAPVEPEPAAPPLPVTAAQAPLAPDPAWTRFRPPADT